FLVQEARVTFLVHMDCRAIAERVFDGDELEGRRPPCCAFYLDCRIVRNWAHELQVQTIFNPEIEASMWRVKWPAFEADPAGLNAHRRAVDGDGKVGVGRRLK